MRSAEHVFATDLSMRPARSTRRVGAFSSVLSMPADVVVRYAEASGRLDLSINRPLTLHEPGRELLIDDHLRLAPRSSGEIRIRVIAVEQAPPIALASDHEIGDD
jgi:hypothetical protein